MVDDRGAEVGLTGTRPRVVYAMRAHTGRWRPFASAPLDLSEVERFTARCC